jgi:hypothetical protein
MRGRGVRGGGRAVVASRGNGVNWKRVQDAVEGLNDMTDAVETSVGKTQSTHGVPTAFVTEPRRAEIETRGLPRDERRGFGRLPDRSVEGLPRHRTDRSVVVGSVAPSEERVRPISELAKDLGVSESRLCSGGLGRRT